MGDHPVTGSVEPVRTQPRSVPVTNLVDPVADGDPADVVRATEVAAPPLPRARRQDPKHLDQRLPAGPQAGLRSFHHAWQPLVTTLDYGVGDVMVRADGTRLNDRADAAFARARIDSGAGAALHAEWWGSDSELFAGKFISDGVEPKKAHAELGGADVFPHYRFDNTSGNWSIPVRFGLFADWHQLDHQQARVEREWLSFGPRLVIEPTWKMLEGRDSSLHLFTRVGADAGAAWFTEEYRNGDDRDFLPRWAGEVGAGLRGEYGAWHFELGYRLHHTMYGESQGDLFGSPGRTELQRQQLFFGLGVSY